MKRTLGIAAVVVVLLALVPEVSLACPVCYGDPNSPLTKGTNNGIIVLLAIIGFVQIGFVALFWSFWRRSQAQRKRREQFRLIEGGAAQTRA